MRKSFCSSLLSVRRVSPLLASAAAITLLTQCDKKPEAAAAESAAVAAAIVKEPSMLDHAGKLGFASKLPLDTEFYLGTVGLKGHIDALKKTNYWKDFSALVDDKAPAATAGDSAQEALKKLWGDDVFIAGSSGFGATGALLKDLNRLYNEIYFKMIMSGTATQFKAGADAAPAPNPFAMLQGFLGDAAQLEKVADLVARFELPPFVIGLKTEKPEERIKELLTEEVLKEMEKGKITVGDLKTAEGYAFKTFIVDVQKMAPPDSRQKALSSLPPDLPPASKAAIERALDAALAKKFYFGLGAVGDHLILATGKNLDHLKFAKTPGDSLLAKPEMNNLLPHVAKNVSFLVYGDGKSFSSMHDDQPILPMLKGVVAAMKENTTFKAIGDTLDKKLLELGPLESAVFGMEFTNMAGISWWDKGLHADFHGGAVPRAYVPGKKLTYAPLLDQPGVVMGFTYHHDPAFGKAVRAWMEKLSGTVYAGAQELVKAGIAGPEGGQKFAMFEMMFLPIWQKVYQAHKDIEQKGLGEETAFLVDINGKMPELDYLPPTPDLAFPRLTTISAVVNRGEVAKGWKTITDTVGGIAAMLGAGGGAPGGPLIPEAESAVKNGMTTWYYPSPMLAGDLYPCSAINDKILILSTSREAADTFSAELAKPSTSTIDGVYGKLDVGSIADYAVKVAEKAPGSNPEKVKEAKQNMKWIKPFRVAKFRAYLDNGHWRSTLDWEITDVVSFD